MSRYTDYAVRFVVNQPDANGNCTCGSRVPHQHIVLSRMESLEVYDDVDQDLIFNEDSDTDQAAIMAKMCRRAIKLNGRHRASN